MLKLVPTLDVTKLPNAGTRNVEAPGIKSHQMTTPPVLVGSVKSATVVAVPWVVRYFATASKTPESDATPVGMLM